MADPKTEMGISLNAMRKQHARALQAVIDFDEKGDTKSADKWTKRAEQWNKAIQLVKAAQKDG